MSFARGISFARAVKNCANTLWLTRKIEATHFQKRMLSTSMCINERYYSKEHEWVDVTDDLAKVGITEYAQEALGEIVYVELPDIEDQFDLDDAVGAVESVKAASDIMAPVSGVINDVNEHLTKNPGLVNQSPEDEGWMFTIKMSNQEELSELLDAGAYKSFCVDNES